MDAPSLQAEQTSLVFFLGIVSIWTGQWMLLHYKWNKPRWYSSFFLLLLPSSSLFLLPCSIFFLVPCSLFHLLPCSLFLLSAYLGLRRTCLKHTLLSASLVSRFLLWESPAGHQLARFPRGHQLVAQKYYSFPLFQYLVD